MQGVFYKIFLFKKKYALYELQKHVEFRISIFVFNVIRSSDLITFLSLCILIHISETVCDKGTSLVLFKRFYEKSYNSDNIESNTNTLCNENETRLLRKMVYAPFNHISVSFISGENWGTRRKLLTCPKSLTNFIT